MPSPVAYLGLGSNLGDRLANLRQALRLLAEGAQVEAVSSLYETEPVGVTDQPSFYNAVCRVTTDMAPRDLLEFLKGIERALGRRPGAAGRPRPIDLDILLYNGRALHEEDLIVPHPRLAERAFVLVPLRELSPDLVHPLLRQSISQLSEVVGEAGVRKISTPGWEK